ncbi:Peptidase M15 [Owenweeksia hongkongensis DSM 17368]|uniref:Peptidase M15 n=1 Tax=Owenweeksia hongkongensis (strain DSM 17368 / CIP 108786 / JCM 12287 / NRRL B-23963 / UST20020801) TaxID=926562 RepID=G8R8K0_OWEHD|nr:D-Ala-D-Ala carboxypeptidase family metallohydrolase [Owenweeksia hongkongensis]AEV31382.1 Peptidase M15 [Owenweeksia hongkongensis DSM 17368]
MNLSTNLSLLEVTKSQTAVRHSIDNTPNAQQLENLKRVAENIFQPIREHFNTPIFISSGFRCEDLNTRIGGSRTSSHCKGEALDIDMDGRGTITNRQVFDYVRANLQFDQLIYEFGDDQNPGWVHISYKKTGNRNQVLKASKVNGRTTYTQM